MADTFNVLFPIPDLEWFAKLLNKLIISKSKLSILLFLKFEKLEAQKYLRFSVYLIIFAAQSLCVAVGNDSNLILHHYVTS